MNYSKV